MNLGPTDYESAALTAELRALLRCRYHIGCNRDPLPRRPERLQLCSPSAATRPAQAIVGELGDALKIALTAPPVDGRANEACVEFFADVLGVPRSSIMIASGQNGRNKVIRVTGLAVSELKKRLDEV